MNTDKVTLYIATHNKTGKKYFGKTTRYFTEHELQENYSGSGTYWKNHLRKHGDDVTMEIYGVFSLDENSSNYVKPMAIKFSEDNDIVNSKEWANLILENGLDGNTVGCIPWNKDKKIGNLQSIKSNETLRNEIVDNKNGLVRKSQKAMKTMGIEGLKIKAHKRVETIKNSTGFEIISKKISVTLTNTKRIKSIEAFGLFEIILADGSIYKSNLVRKEIIEISKALWTSSNDKPIGLNNMSSVKLINNNKEYLIGSFIRKIEGKYNEI